MNSSKVSMIAEGHWAISFMETEKEVEAEDDGEVI